MFLQVTPLISYNLGELSQQKYGGNLLVETFVNPGLVVKLVLILLLMMSVVCWGIVLYKLVVFRRTERRSRQFSALLSSSDDLAAICRSSEGLPNNPLKQMFEAGYREFTKRVAFLEGASAGFPDSTVSGLWREEIESVRRALKKAQSEARTNLESALTFLATTGSTAPFIGLFGTVWGIMTSFRSIGVSGNASLAVVAPGIAEALIATAVGLFAAIPAVVAYNYFLNWGRLLGSQMENFSSDFQSVTEHQLRQMFTQKNRPRQPMAA
jgi:biopolymer transport protein TolQ